METHKLTDPAPFARALRHLAQEAHQTLAHAPSPADLRRLSRRIENLNCALGDHRQGPVATWLDNLGRDVRVAMAEARRAMCLCA